MVRLLSVALIFVGLASQARAEDAFAKHEILFSPSSGSMQFNSSRTVFSISGGYNYRTHEVLQWGIFPTLSYNSSPSNTILSVLAGPTFNFPRSAPLRESFLISGRAGFEHSTAGGTQFSFGFEGGKRFALGDQVTYRPTLGLLKTTGQDLSFVVNLLAFSAIL